MERNHDCKPHQLVIALSGLIVFGTYLGRDNGPHLKHVIEPDHDIFAKGLGFAVVAGSLFLSVAFIKWTQTFSGGWQTVLTLGFLALMIGIGYAVDALDTDDIGKRWSKACRSVLARLQYRFVSVVTETSNFRRWRR
jgi:hypothetical protein